MVDVSEQAKRLRQSKVFLAENYDRMSAANMTIQNTSEILHNTNRKYTGIIYY